MKETPCARLIIWRPLVPYHDYLMRSMEPGETDRPGHWAPCHRPGPSVRRCSAAAVAIMKRGKKWPLNGLLHLNRDLVAVAATAGLCGGGDSGSSSPLRATSSQLFHGRRRREWIPRRNGAGEQILHFYAWLPGKAAKPRTILRPAHSLQCIMPPCSGSLPPSLARSKVIMKP